MKLIETDTRTGSRDPRDLVHPGSRALFRYWETIRGERSVPSRSDLDLRKIRHILPWLFILERNPVRQAYRWRLAGTGICRLWGRELTGGELLVDWREQDRPALAGAFDRVIGALQPCVARIDAMSIDRNRAKVELLGLPIRSRSSNQVQILGSILPLETPEWLGQTALGLLTLESARIIWTEPIPGAPAGLLAPAPVPSAPSRGHGVFTLIHGGKADI